MQGRRGVERQRDKEDSRTVPTRYPPGSNAKDSECKKPQTAKGGKAENRAGAIEVRGSEGGMEVTRAGEVPEGRLTLRKGPLLILRVRDPSDLRAAPFNEHQAGNCGTHRVEDRFRNQSRWGTPNAA